MPHIIKLNISYSKQLAEIHKNAFPGFFLTELGPKVLEIFYTSLMRDSNSIVWGVTKDNVLAGFFAATKNSNGLYLRIFIKNIYRFFIPLTLSFIRNPILLRKMIISFKSSSDHNVPKNCTSSLLSICVSPVFAGNGIGKLLISTLEIELIKGNIAKYYLTTDADNNDFVKEFYLKAGFCFYSNYCQGNRKMNIYLKELI